MFIGKLMDEHSYLQYFTSFNIVFCCFDSANLRRNPLSSVFLSKFSYEQAKTYSFRIIPKESKSCAKYVENSSEP